MSQKDNKEKKVKIASMLGFGLGFVDLLIVLNKFLNKSVPDSEKKHLIWKTVAGNNKESKLDNMVIDFKDSNSLIAMVKFFTQLATSKYKDEEEVVDTFTYLYSIKGGYEKETYEDEPYLIPYLIKNSDQTVIIVCGGGYGYKSIQGGTKEGKDIALSLNKNGINAFVLYYRSNPYEYPIPTLDLQRAIRYLKYHANEYHIDKNKISILGFSAGGNLVGTFINQIQGKDYFPINYQKDIIDNVDDSVNMAAMIYPALSYKLNVPMLFCSFPSTLVKNETTRNELLEKTNLAFHFSSSNISQFIAYGTKDRMVGMKETKKYIQVALKNKTNIKVIEAKGQPHGFKQSYYMKEYISWLKQKDK